MIMLRFFCDEAINPASNIKHMHLAECDANDLLTV